MDNISSKNEAFLTGELKILSTIDDLEMCKKSIISLIDQYSVGLTTNIPDINSKMDEAAYYKRMIEDTASSINMYSSALTYQDSDLKDKVFTTKKNAYISNVNIPNTIPIGEFIDDFTVNITNLGFDGISAGDSLYVSMYSMETLIYTEVTIPITSGVSGIGEKMELVVHGLPCPSNHSQYSMDLILATSEDVQYASATIEGINVAIQEKNIEGVNI